MLAGGAGAVASWPVVAALNVGVPAATVSAAALKEKALARYAARAMDLSLQL